jgi:hypothetical protein
MGRPVVTTITIRAGEGQTGAPAGSRGEGEAVPEMRNGAAGVTAAPF